MSKKFKAQASSARAASASFGSNAFLPSSPASFQTASSPLSYVAELPDLNGISDPKLVVALKNLGKKDSTTKAKALEELQEHLATLGASGAWIEPAFLEAWTVFYPRTSTENSRRVRHLAHTLQGVLTALSGKRIAPYLPKLIASWLSGRFDSDRGVSRAVQEGLEKAFPAIERRKALWMVYQDHLIDYAEDAILVQTAQTLSDERTTSPDDAEAKQVRVAGNAILMLLQLLQSLDGGPSVPSNPKIESVLSAETTWTFANHADPHLRRSVYGLLKFCIGHYPSVLSWVDLSTVLLNKSLHTNQLGSSRQYSEVLLAATTYRPQIWTSDYTAKTPVSRRLLQFLKQGSQRGPEEFWTNLSETVRKLPPEVWQSKDAEVRGVTAADCKALLQALLEGVSSSEEPRSNALVAWTAYVDLSIWTASKITEAGERNVLLQEHVSPLVTWHVTHSVDYSRWALPSTISARVCSHYFLCLIKHSQISFIEEIWSQQVGHLTDAVKLSLPGTSKEFESSQDAVLAQSERFFTLESDLQRKRHEQDLRSPHVETAFQLGHSRLLSSSLDILKSRNGKPYAASGIVLSVIPLLTSKERSDQLDIFLANDLANLLDSPSSEQLISILFTCREYPAYPGSLRASIHVVLRATESPRRLNTLRTLVERVNALELSENPELGKFVFEQLDLALNGNSSAWPIVYAAVLNRELNLDQNTDIGNKGSVDLDLDGTILGRLLDGLTLEATQYSALDGLGGLLSTSGKADFSFIESFTGSLLSKTLRLSDSADDQIAERAKQLTSKLKNLMTKLGATTVTTSTIQVIRDQFQGNGEPLSIFGLLELARDTFQTANPEVRAAVAGAVLPTAEDWRSALLPFIPEPPARSTAITSPLSATVYIVESARKASSMPKPRDMEGFSTAYRLAFCVTRLLRSTDLVNYLDSQKLKTLFTYLPQAIELINDKITLDVANDIWEVSTQEVLEEATEIVSECRSQIKAWCELTQTYEEDSSNAAAIDQHWLEQMDKIHGNSPEMYHLAQACTSVMSECIDINGLARYLDAFSADLKVLRKSDNLIRSAVVAAVLSDVLASSAQGKKLCNELIADATELEQFKPVDACLRPLLLLNTLLQDDDGLIDSIPQQRSVFLFQNLVHLSASGDGDAGLMSETLRLLYLVLPAVLEIYGEHWKQLIDLMLSYWNVSIDKEEDLAMLYSSLRLYARMSILVRKENTNEDFLDAWNASKSQLHAGLIKVLTQFDLPPVGMNQPRDVTTEFLRRLLLNVNPGSLSVSEKLYRLLASPEVSVQSAAYDLLHRSIPARQAKMSVDIALEKKTARLPSQLISLVLDRPPVKESQTWEASQQSLRNDLRRFLLSWNLIFDHFVKSSYKLREMYATEIKEINSVYGLLDLACVVLRIASGRPVDPSKFEIQSFETDTPESREKEIHWLMVHIYHNCLLYIPGLTKDWFIQQKNRIKSPLESWTHKYFSPLIVSEVLSAVTEWATTQDADDRPVTIKSSPKGSELTASIVIDEESPPVSMSISMPGAYPLEQVLITSRNRVGVSEKNWQSWLRTFQIIIFSSGSLIEGLVAFRRNVQGALRGQSECAICYSIIGTDMKTPDKKCSTCKNTFHGVCLYRWFKSSNTSTCPLCRNNFNYA